MSSSSTAFFLTSAILYSSLLTFSLFLALANLSHKWRTVSHVYLVSFCICRIVEAALQVSHNASSQISLPSPPAMMLEEIALAPLLLSFFCILNERNVSPTPTMKPPATSQKQRKRLAQAYLSMIHLIAALALSLAPGAAGLYPHSRGLVFARASAALYLLLYILVVVQSCYHLVEHSYGQRRQQHQKLATPNPHKYTSLATILSLPFLGIRIVYFLCATIVLSHATNPFTGPVVNRVFLGMLPELVVCAIHTVIGVRMLDGPSAQLGGGNEAREVFEKSAKSADGEREDCTSEGGGMV